MIVGGGTAGMILSGKVRFETNSPIEIIRLIMRGFRAGYSIRGPLNSQSVRAL